MPSTTLNLALYKPDLGENDVADELNANADTIDARFSPTVGHTHDGTTGDAPKIPVSSINAGGTPDAMTFLRGDGLWASGGGEAGVTDHGELTGLSDDDHTIYYNQARGDTRYVQRANNLSDVANAATARSNLGAAAATHAHAAADITSGTVATARLGSGTASAQTFLRGDQTWAAPPEPGVSGSGLWTWKSTVTTSDPGTNNVGVNNDLPASATVLYLNKFAPNSIDYTGLLSALRDGDTIYLQQADTSASWHRYEVTATPTASGNAFAIPVSTLGGSVQGTEPANNARVYLIINNAPASSTSLTTENVQDIVAAEIVAGTGITATYDDTGGTVTLASTGGLPASPTSGTYLAVNTANTPIWALGGGTTAARPTSTARALYHRYYDTTLNKPLTFDGTVWRDATGADMGGDTPTIITSGLIFALAMSEGSGQTLAALSPTSYGAVIGSTSGVDANDPDWVAQGLDFNPANADQVTASGVPDTGWLGAITAMVVAKIDTGGDWRGLISKHTGNATGSTPLAFQTEGSATPNLHLNRANVSYSAWTGPAVTLGSYRCYSVTVTADIGVAPTFYIGTTATTGASNAGGGTGAPLGSSADVRVGRSSHGGFTPQMDGVIAYVLVYSRVLSAGEIATNYTALQAIMAARGVSLP